MRIPGWSKSNSGVPQDRIDRAVPGKTEGAAVFDPSLLDKYRSGSYYDVARRDSTMESLLVELEKLQEVRTSDSRTRDDRREADLHSRIAKRYKELGSK